MLSRRLHTSSKQPRHGAPKSQFSFEFALPVQHKKDDAKLHSCYPAATFFRHDIPEYRRALPFAHRASGAVPNFREDESHIPGSSSTCPSAHRPALQVLTLKFLVETLVSKVLLSHLHRV